MRIFSDISKLDFSTPVGRDKIFAALNYFASGKGYQDRVKKYAAQLQAFGSPSDFPTSILPLIEKYNASPAYDTGYEEIFDIRDFTGSRRNGFELLDVEDGLTFAKVPLGEKAQIFKMAGAKTTVIFDLYGGGLGWHRTLIDDEEYWTFEDNAKAFVNKAYENKAAAFYALIEAIGAGQNVAWQLPDPAALATSDATYTANRDVQTLNTAAQTILLATKDKGYGITPGNASFVVLAPLQLVGRLNKALGLALQGFGGSPSQVIYKFRLVPTTMLATTNVYYVAIPKIKAKGGNRMNLTIFNKFDEESYSDIAVGWMRYGGAIGDQDQFCRCAIS